MYICAKVVVGFCLLNFALSSFAMDVDRASIELFDYFAGVKQSEIEQTNFTPQNKRNYSLCSPVKEKVVKKVKLNNHEAKVIYSDDWQFKEKIWAFADPFRPLDLVIVDGGHKVWRGLVQKFLRKVKDRKLNQVSYILAIISFVHDNIDEMAQKAGFFEGNVMVCRHFSTIALPFLIRVLEHEKIPLWGTPHQESSHEILTDWLNTTAHAWNVLWLDDIDGNREFIFLDIYNKTFANISDSPSMSDIILYSTIKNNNNKPLKEDDFFYDYIRVTREKYNIHNARENSVYQHAEDHYGVAKRFVQRHLMPTKLRFDIMK